MIKTFLQEDKLKTIPPKPDIDKRNKEDSTALIIKISVHSDFGITIDNQDKITKYQDLRNTLKDEWELKLIGFILIIIGATVQFKNNSELFLDAMPGRPKKYQIQVKAIRGTVSHLIRCLDSSFKHA